MRLKLFILIGKCKYFKRKMMMDEEARGMDRGGQHMWLKFQDEEMKLTAHQQLENNQAPIPGSLPRTCLQRKMETRLLTLFCSEQ